MDKGRAVAPLPFGHEALDRLEALREATFGGKPLPGDSSEFIREDREARSGQRTVSYSGTAKQQ